MKLKENFIKGKGAVSCGALLINIPLQVQCLHYSGVTHAQEGPHARVSPVQRIEISLFGEGGGEGPEQRVILLA